MRKLLTFLIATIFSISVSAISFGGSMGLMGVGGGASVAPPYTGPGDTFSTSVIGAYSCSEAYNAAGANTSTSACDLVDSAAPTTVICTLRFTSTGKVDLTAYCPGSVTPAAKCAAATGGVCNISQAYDLSGHSRPVLQATAANQPTLTFSSSPTGTLPVINCGTAASNISLTTTATITQAQPYSFAAVMERTNSFTSAGGAIGGIAASNKLGLGSESTANTVQINGGGSGDATASDSVWHAVNGMANGNGTSAINVDGTDNAVVAAGINNFSSEPFRLCRGAGSQYPGLIAEALFFGTSTTSTNRGALSTNAHSAGRYNF